jgi:hypothetical protein
MIKKLIAILFLISSVVQSQTIITVPTTSGGAVDILARKFAKFAELKTGNTFIIENIGGAGGNIGIAKFIKSSPNSLMISSSSWYISINQGKFNLEEFRPIRILSEAPFFLAVNSNQNLTCEKLKSPTRRYFIGTAAMSHTEMIGKIISSKYNYIENIPYKAVKQAVIDLMGNHIDAAITGSATEISYPLIGLANSTNQKINGIPSFSECLGINTSGYIATFLLLANKNSDDKFIELIDSLVTEFIQDKDIQAYYKENLMQSNSTGHRKMNSIIASQLQRWKELEK